MQRFRNKYLLLDTNLLITISKYLSLGFFERDFLNELEKQNIKSVIEEGTLFEFRRGSRTKEQLVAKNNFLDFLLGEKKNQMILQSINSREIINNAEMLAILYSHTQINLSKQISLTDCLIAAQLMKYKNNLYLATMDNNDYPLFIFDRLKLITIDTEKEIINIGIYQFNQGKYHKRLEAFEKSR